MAAIYKHHIVRIVKKLMILRLFDIMNNAKLKKAHMDDFSRFYFCMGEKSESKNIIIIHCH